MSWLPGLVVGVMFGVGVVLVFARKEKGWGFYGRCVSPWVRSVNIGLVPVG